MRKGKELFKLACSLVIACKNNHFLMIQQPYQEKKFIDAISKAGVGGWGGGRALQNLTAQKCRRKYCLEKNKTINLALYVEKV